MIRPRKSIFGGVAKPTTLAPLTSSAILGRGTGNPTFTRATTAKVFDWEGVLRTAAISEPRFQGPKRVQNFVSKSEDLSSAPWTLGGTATVTGTTRLNLPALSDEIHQSFNLPTGNVVTGQKFRLSMRVTYVSGAGNLTVGIKEGAGLSYILSKSVPLVGAANNPGPRMIVGEVTTVAGYASPTLYLFLYNSIASSLVVDITQIMVEDVTGEVVLSGPVYTGNGVLSAPYYGAGVDGVQYLKYNRLRNNGVAIGDSFTTGGEYINSINSPEEPPMVNKGTDGETLVQILARFNTDVITLLPKPKFVVLQGGINDLQAAVSDPNTSMRANMTSMIATAIAASITPIVFGTQPWKGSTNWNASRQAWQDSYEAWLASYAIANSISYFSIYRLLIDPNVPLTMLPAYDSGDHLHPNIPGYGVIGNAIGPYVPTPVNATIDSSSLYGYLQEEARTNNCLWNRDFTNAAWVKTTMTVAKDQTGIDGFPAVASSLLATGANATVKQTVTIAAVSRPFSVYIKRLVGSGNIDLAQDGASYTTQTVTTAWTRCTLQASQLNPVLSIRLATSGDQVAVDFAMLEDTGGAAAPFVLSPIATTTVAVTRNVDILTYPTSGNVNDAAGTCYAEVTGVPPGFSSNLAVVAARSGASGGQQMFVATGTRALSLYDGTATRSFNTLSSPQTTFAKIATVWGASASNGYINGVIGTAAGFDGSMDSNANMGIGCNVDGVSPFNGTIKNLGLWTRVVTNPRL